MSRTLAIIITCICLFTAGCPSMFNPDNAEKQPSPEELFEKAEAAYDKKNYDSAIELYERLSSAHPDFEKMPIVYEKIADSLYANNEYGRAIARYRQFIELYPTHEHAARAKYMQAMCYFKQIKRMDLDSRFLVMAEKEFKAIKDDQKSGEWAEKAEEKYLECKKKLCEKELYKARTYYSMGKYTSAKVAGKRVLSECSEVGLEKEADKIIKKAEYYIK
jgi:outer membrane protein assembly factor BamD